MEAAPAAREPSMQAQFELWRTMTLGELVANSKEADLSFEDFCRTMNLSLTLPPNSIDLGQPNGVEPKDKGGLDAAAR